LEIDCQIWKLEDAILCVADMEYLFAANVLIKLTGLVHLTGHDFFRNLNARCMTHESKHLKLLTSIQKHQIAVVF